MNTSKNKQTLRSLLIAGTFLAGSALPSVAASYHFLGSGAQVRSELSKTSLEAKCSSGDKTKEGKCGNKTDSTQTSKGKMSKSHGKMKDGKCGQGKCGSKKPK